MATPENAPAPREDMSFDLDNFPHGVLTSLFLVFGAVIVGVLTGFIGMAFLYCLEQGNTLRLALTEHLKDAPPFLGWLALASLVAAAAAFAAWLVQRFAPTAGGSGVPYCEKILRGHDQPRHAWVLPVKFFGGAIALSAGLLLGREGPLVQMGAVIGEKVGRLIPGMRDAWKALMTAGAGAGLATAFNAPVGGTIFILEEVQRRVTPLSFVLAATAATTSTFIQRAIFHSAKDYQVAVTPIAPAESVWLFLIFGALIGGIGIYYNQFLLWLVALGPRLRGIPTPARAAIVGLIVGTVGWFAPDWVGGGDNITQSILSGGTVAIFGLAVARIILSPLSYAAGTPGGLFAPIIALGAIFGIAFGTLQNAVFPEAPIAPIAFAVAGMAGFFTATIRAPITGIVICLEMTGCYSLFYPMLVTGLGAYLIPTLARSQPIYDALAESKPK